MSQARLGRWLVYLLAGNPKGPLPVVVQIDPPLPDVEYLCPDRTRRVVPAQNQRAIQGALTDVAAYIQVLTGEEPVMLQSSHAMRASLTLPQIEKVAIHPKVRVISLFQP